MNGQVSDLIDGPVSTRRRESLRSTAPNASATRPAADVFGDEGLSKRYPGIGSCAAVSCSPAYPPLPASSILELCHPAKVALVSAYAGILTPRTSTTDAELSARFVRTAVVGGATPGRSGGPSGG